MRAVVQRVSSASVAVEAETVASVGRGVLVLVGVADADDARAAERLAAKIANLRIFDDDAGRFDRSLLDVAGEALVVSQFTLLADSRKGNRPSFTRAAEPELAASLYELVCDGLQTAGVAVSRGVFGARMQVSLVNDGPVTIIFDV